MPLALINKAQTAILLIVFGLTGCSSMRLVDSQVSSFAPRTVPAGASYRFERLPSQQAQEAAQQQLEAMTELALAKVGLQRGDANAPFSVQVSATQRQQTYAVDHGGFGWSLGWMGGSGGGGSGLVLGMRHGVLFPGLDARVNIWREVSLILRESASQTVVFESKASHDGPWSDSGAVFPAMLDAALQGFPNPPAGTRQVNIEIPR